MISHFRVTSELFASTLKYGSTDLTDVPLTRRAHTRATRVGQTFSPRIVAPRRPACSLHHAWHAGRMLARGIHNGDESNHGKQTFVVSCRCSARLLATCLCQCCHAGHGVSLLQSWHCAHDTASHEHTWVMMEATNAACRLRSGVKLVDHIVLASH